MSKPLDMLSIYIDKAAMRRVDALGPPSAEEYFKARSVEKGTDYLHGIMNVIDGNTSTLLTHISAMIAVLGIMLIIFEDTGYTRIFVMVEMIAYTVLAIVCVMNMRWRGFVSTREKMEVVYLYRTYLRRRYLYQFCVDSVVYITLLFLVTVIIHLIGLLI